MDGKVQGLNVSALNNKIKFFNFKKLKKKKEYVILFTIFNMKMHAHGGSCGLL